MTEREDLVLSIADTTCDYRIDELSASSPSHINRWLNQFADPSQLPILRELNHVLSSTYYKRDTVIEYLNHLLSFKGFAGDDPKNYWLSVNFLNIQRNGHSQQAMLALIGELLFQKFKIQIDECGSNGGDYIYIDDGLFSGMHIGNDLEEWIKQIAPVKANIKIIVIVLHTLGRFLANNRLEKIIKEEKKEIELNWWRFKVIENRKIYKNDSEVLWPTQIFEDDNLKTYLTNITRFPFEPRTAGGKLGPFSSEDGRQLLERELLLAGLKIRSFCNEPSESLKPLGFSSFGLGFGSMIVTYRNCPNNCPLALWWGDPSAGASSPLSKWYPLFPRKTYNEDS